MKANLTIIRGNQTREGKRQAILKMALKQQEDFTVCAGLINRINASINRLEGDL